mmetsp:Transcript_155736/g.270965  ORF Transcript_155736/g.270965 Transcript_155736/m.270965 type:complete len:82 (-) Transcript_155736:169-414(-)
MLVLAMPSQANSRQRRRCLWQLPPLTEANLAAGLLKDQDWTTLRNCYMTGNEGDKRIRLICQAKAHRQAENHGQLWAHALT